MKISSMPEFDRVAEPPNSRSRIGIHEAVRSFNTIVIEARKSPAGGRELDHLARMAKIEMVSFNSEQAEIARDASTGGDIRSVM